MSPDCVENDSTSDSESLMLSKCENFIELSLCWTKEGISLLSSKRHSDKVSVDSAIEVPQLSFGSMQLF